MGALGGGVGWCFGYPPAGTAECDALQGVGKFQFAGSAGREVRDLAQVFSLSPLWGEGGVWGAVGRQAVSISSDVEKPPTPAPLPTRGRGKLAAVYGAGMTIERAVPHLSGVL